MYSFGCPCRQLRARSVGRGIPQTRQMPLRQLQHLGRLRVGIHLHVGVQLRAAAIMTASAKFSWASVQRQHPGRRVFLVPRGFLAARVFDARFALM